MKEVIIVGGGASVKDGIALDLWKKIEGKNIWSLNYAFMTMPYLPSRQVWVDISFFKNNQDMLQNLWKQGVEMVAKKHRQYADLWEIQTYEQTRLKTGYKGKDAFRGVEQPHIFLGRMGMCGTFALSLAVAEGYDMIYLLGYDFGTPDFGDKNTHYYQDQVKVRSTGVGNINVYRGGDKSNKSNVKTDIQDYDVFMPSLDSGEEIINESLRSHLYQFPKISYEQFFERLNEDNHSGQ